ncbi:MAG: hypothetical protein ACQEP9_04410 [Bacillota bacterium]
MLNWLDKLLGKNQQNSIVNLSQKLTGEVYSKQELEDLEQLLDKREIELVNAQPAIILLGCQLFSYRVVIRSNDIPISFGQLEKIYDNLAKKLSDLASEGEIELEAIKEDVKELLETYKSSSKQRKRIKIKEVIAELVADLDLEKKDKQKLKDYLEQLILQNITIIQDFFINQTSQL